MKIIAFAHTKGGVGKSTLAWNYAHSLIEIDKSVTLLDLDFQQTICFVNAIAKTQKLTVLQPQSVEELLHECITPSIESDYYIIDIGGFDNDINRAAIDMAHITIIPISNSITEVLGFKTFESILAEMILGEREVRLVLNNIHPLAKNFDNLKEALGDVKILGTVVRNRKEWRESMGEGLSILDMPNATRSKEELRALRDEIAQVEREYEHRCNS